ncbi:MAG: hypothetical protein ACPGGA_04360 [Balneolaceae bacterium]
MSSKESQNIKVTIKDSKTDVFDASIESDNDIFITSVKHGVEEEDLDFKAITIWSILGIVTVVVFVAILIPFAQFSINAANENANLTSTYYEIRQLNEDANAILNSYGVIDGEEGIYRIPIDEAINKLATD